MYTVKVYGGSEEWLHALLISAQIEVVSLTAPSLYHRGKSLRPIGILCDPEQGRTYNRIPRLGIEARFLRGLGSLPVTASLVLFRIFVQMNIKMLLTVL